MMASKKKKSIAINDSDQWGKNVKIPLNEFNIIKKYVDEHQYKLGGFVAIAAIEKINREKQANK